MTTDTEESILQEINLRDYWRVLVKRRWILITFFLVLVGTVVIYTFSMVPTYRATTQILIEKTNPNIISPQEMMVMDPTGTDFYHTHYKILESRSLAQEVIKRLHLNRHPEFKMGKGHTEGGVLKTIDEVLKAINSLIEYGLYQIKGKKPERNPRSTEAPSLLDHLLEEALLITPPLTDNSPHLVSPFLRRLKIEPIRNSRLVNIHFESIDPELAARVTKTVAQAYIDWNLGLRLRTQQNLSNFLDDQVKEVRRKLDASEQALQNYREKYGVAAISGKGGKGAEEGQDISRLKMIQINSQLVEISKHRIEAEIQYQNALKALKNPKKAESLPEVINNPAILNIKEEEIKLLREKAEKSEKFALKHPIILSLNQEIENLKKKKIDEINNIVDAMRTKYVVALNQERSLQKALMDSQDQTIQKDKIAIQYQLLQQEAESNRTLYDMLLKRQKEANVTEENRTVNIHIVDLAEIPKVPYKPKVKLNILLAVLVGLFLGVGAVFFIEYLDNTIKTPDDLKRHLNIPYLGPVHHFKINKPELPQSDLITFNDPKSSMSEAYRGIRTSILFSTPNRSPRSLIITSADPKEGKTITCVNLSVVMAQAGQKVLILEGDMHRPKLHKIFNLKNDRGLSNILVGEGNWREVKSPTSIPNLDVITSGPLPPNPADLIGSDRMRDFIKEAVEEYSSIIFDSPPVSSVTDPVILSRFVEGVVLVIRVGKTPREHTANSIRLLRDVQSHILGAVLNDINVGKDSYYYYYYHYYYYGEDGVRKKIKSKHKKSHSTSDIQQVST